jgi:hypothetical protein
MKIFILCLFWSVQLLAQNANITNETNLNNQLLQNSALSEQYQQQAGGTTSRISGNTQVGTSTTNNNGLNLTDQDKQLSENYVNQIGTNKILNEKCSGDMKTICAGQAGQNKFLGIDSSMIEMVGKAYAMFGGMSDGKLTMTGPDPAKGATTPAAPAADATKTAPAADGAKADVPKKETHQASDNCKYIPTISETLATFSQQQTANSLTGTPQTADTAQRDTLLKAAKSHEERGKVAQIQAIGWFGGAACYGYMAMTGAVVDTSLIVKIGAGVFLGSFYQNEVSTNQQNADKIRAIAASLPGKGDCNPVTQKPCYCAQKENQADPQYVQYCNPPGASTNPIASTSYRVACTDSNMKIDPACNCTKTNSCVDQLLGKQIGAVDLGLGTIGGGPLSDFRSLTRGELTNGNLSGSTGGAAMALAKRAMLAMASQVPRTNNNLNPNQNAFANGLMSKGIPAALANVMAQQNVPSGSLGSAMAKFQGSAGSYSASAPAYARSNTLDFSGGFGLGTSGKAASSKKNDDFLAKLNPGAKGPGNARVMEFAAKAQVQGQILKAETPLFEIISNRYQQTGRRLLEVENTK